MQKCLGGTIIILVGAKMTFSLSLRMKVLGPNSEKLEKKFHEIEFLLESVTALYETHFWLNVLNVVLDSDSSEM